MKYTCEIEVRTRSFRTTIVEPKPDITSGATSRTPELIYCELSADCCCIRKIHFCANQV